MDTGDARSARRGGRASWQAAIFLSAAGLLIAAEQWGEQWILPDAAAATAVRQMQPADAPADRLRMIDTVRQWLPMATALSIVVTAAAVFAPKPGWLFSPGRWAVWLRWRVRRPATWRR